MTTVKLTGGLGNQMFQYAQARARSILDNSPIELDISWYSQSKNRRFDLGEFNIPSDILASAEKVSWFEKYFRRFRPAKDKYDWSENDLRGAEELLKKEFTLRQPLSKYAAVWENKILASESASIHIRRGDYLWEKHKKIYSEIPPDYYKQASEILATKKPDVKFFVFTDDPSWVKENFKFDFPFELVSDGVISSAEEIILMSLCKHNIIANSTFSWWGAWLNRNPNKVVIAPQKWFIDRSSDNLIPDSWIKI